MTIAQLRDDFSRYAAALATGNSQSFQQVGIDSRKIKAGDFFVALRGPNFDGHAYLQQVQEKGAVGALVDTVDPDCDLPQLQVDDTVLGLGELARINRQRFTGPVIAVTGSSGKTTVRTMVDGILREQGPVLSTQGNLNNHIGVPLTLLRLSGNESFAIVEMGASSIGEIAYLCELALPDVGLVNNVMPAHLEGFGSLEGVAEAKGEIYQGVKADGCCVINIDDQFSGQWLSQIKKRTLLTFSLNNTQANCYASNIQTSASGLSFDLQLLGRTLPVQLPVSGYHNVRNALAAACCAYAVGARDESIVEGLARFNPVDGRMKFCAGPHGSTIIDDSYNANPGSVRAAIDVLAEIKGVNILVMGDMGELGDESYLHHADIGAYASEKSLQAVFTIGSMAKAVAEHFDGPCKHFETQDDLISHLLCVMTDSDCTVLIKGSRSARMDLVAEALIRGEDI
ncbi:UDP-N-acetylmuramoyl-tripeptide--D-alanyl-D-alanine ligase [Gilvimarinus agarilyticus]|uniref:UDP-N-acetylmuramoyl-tripeptide--D-alanyl-D- alanine ligase n=1 Tax=Gilvimarinus sp. 2_MG-2023 TaxID=3062666 RepID=UPI001C080690|nr:UDP-N-acetylmuramoyl-tripeptide--D-alanyl-D-alanine ligase [Gilvimarinus sp. 2_MG-2023]MBU2885398.1 UDP-N-acetylmuramoyl-tripeptide--D-alanyl-D-alanine ligase [Gilvimarinus agarilyticus]MDO6570297.1 UDP-N-acetylmuramoyl-tripeptide--D-alanyl-D-alanine ligase [Gilvimarinus sp. 2_MG-2023]